MGEWKETKRKMTREEVKNEVKEKLEYNFNRSKEYVMYFIRWMFRAAIVGLLCGLVGAVFHRSLEYVAELRLEHTWLLYFLPLAGVLIVFCYRVCGVKDDRGTNMVLDSIQSTPNMSFRTAPLIFIGTLLTHVCGGSSGREGAALQIGGSLGATVGRIFSLSEKDRKILVMCGMSATFTAMFGTPITATIFSMEVISVGIIYYSAFVPCIISSTIALGITALFQVEPTKFVLKNIPEISPTICIQVIGLAIVVAIVSILFCSMMHHASHAYKKLFHNQYKRIIVGGCLIFLATLLVGNRDYNGPGMEMVERALTSDVPKIAFLLKIVFTALTLGAGFKGGEIVPSLFIGATLGNVIAPLLGLDPNFAAAIGMIAFFCSVVNCPIASIMLGLELFGAADVLLFCIACGVSYVFSGYYGLYSSQKIMYSKLQAEYINRKSK